MTNQVQLNNITFGGNNPFVLIAGPCMIESESLVMETAEQIKNYNKIRNSFCL
jgi:2-dehydro-3-deoxyphosphooctonate aldolase (KDO 8-P synthase)